VPKLPFDLSVPQILGGALAAATAAVVGSRLGVAGTVAGAALASIVAAVGSAVYTASLRRTHRGFRSAWGHVRPAPPRRGDESDDTTPVIEPISATTVPEPSPPMLAPSGLPRPGRGSTHRRRVRAARVAVAACATFILAVMAVTGVELLSGHALDGQRGITVANVGGRGRPAIVTPSTPAPSSTAPSSTTSTDSSGAPSEQPSTEPSASTPPSQPGSSSPSSPASSSAGEPTAPATTGEPSPSVGASDAGPNSQPSTPTSAGNDEEQAR